MSKSTPTPKTAAIYCRVSTTAQSEEGTSLASQETACRAYAEQFGYTVGPIFTDVHSGADLFGRDGMSALLHAIKAREVGIVIAYALDRLSRSQIHFGLIYSEAIHAGVSIELVSEKLDDSPVGRFVMAAQSFSAEIEREKIRERSVRGKLTRIQSGKIHGWGPELYGYQRDRAAGVRIVVDHQAAIVRRIYEAYAGGVSVRSLRRDLEAKGVPPPSSGKIAYKSGRVARWNTAAIYNMLTEPAYKGETIVWRKRGVQGKKGFSVPRDESEWITLPEGVTPAIVSPDLWDAVQERRRVSTAATTRNATRPYLLRGLVWCSVCGCRMKASPHHKSWHYKCSGRDRFGTHCGASVANGPAVEAWVWEQVEAVLRDPDTIVAEVERRRTNGPDATLTATRETATRMLAKLDKQRERLVRLYADADDDKFPMDVVEREIARVESERRAAQATLAEIDERLTEQERTIVQLDDLRTYCDRVSANLDAADFATKRNAVEALVERVEANGRDWTLHCSIPTSTNVGFASTIS